MGYGKKIKVHGFGFTVQTPYRRRFTFYVLRFKPGQMVTGEEKKQVIGDGLWVMGKEQKKVHGFRFTVQRFKRM
jgi:hypothetical protein